MQESDESENPRTKESFRIGQSDSRRTKLDNRNNRRIGSELLITTPIIILFYYSREIVKRKETLRNYKIKRIRELEDRKTNLEKRNNRRIEVNNGSQLPLLIIFSDIIRTHTQLTRLLGHSNVTIFVSRESQKMFS